MSLKIASKKQIQKLKLVHYGSSEFILEKFKPVKNYSNKPYYGTGLWTSPINSEYGWKDFCLSENFHPENLSINFQLKLHPDSKILVIDSYQDLENLSISPGYEKFLKIYTYVDFEKLAEDYDAIWLTEKGQQRTRLSYPKNLYGWDVESVLILNKSCIEVSK